MSIVGYSGLFFFCSTLLKFSSCIQLIDAFYVFSVRLHDTIFLSRRFFSLAFSSILCTCSVVIIICSCRHISSKRSSVFFLSSFLTQFVGMSEGLYLFTLFICRERSRACDSFILRFFFLSRCLSFDCFSHSCSGFFFGNFSLTLFVLKFMVLYTGCR